MKIALRSMLFLPLVLSASLVVAALSYATADESPAPPAPPPPRTVTLTVEELQAIVSAEGVRATKNCHALAAQEDAILAAAQPALEKLKPQISGQDKK